MLASIIRGNELDIVLGLVIAYLLVKYYPEQEDEE